MWPYQTRPLFWGSCPPRKKMHSDLAMQDCLLAGSYWYSVKGTPYTDSFSYHSTSNANINHSLHWCHGGTCIVEITSLTML